MTTELTARPTPKVMQISLYSNIKQKLNFLQQCIKDDAEADTAKLYIECVEKTHETSGGELKTERVVQLSTDLQTWTTAGIFDPENGDLLEMNISVNLYDIYNLVNSCTDDMMSMWIDFDGNGYELVVNSYYNPTQDYDEMEARLRIIDYAFEPIVVTTKLPQKKIATVRLDNLALWHISGELNTEMRTSEVTCIVESGKLSFQSEYNGIQTVLVVKGVYDMDVNDNFSFTLPFHIFNLMCSTGKIGDLCFEIYEDHVTVEGDGYDFCVQRLPSPSKFIFTPETYNDYFVFEAELAEDTFELLNRLNKPCPISTVTIEKASDVTADFTVEYEGRYSISLRPNLAMLSDKILKIDGDILQEFFTKPNVDAIRARYTSDDKVFLSYENAIIIKQMMYDHEAFSKYRSKLVKRD